ncbi:MAG: hypothetical protein KF689_05335 [Gemmatimonadaceae bacterium]|nr:hypothetical protein [Gemmatimonadaceae bacterium]MCW5825403.1 hypothetical protein [Gemmatimonadaceae bacterium]
MLALALLLQTGVAVPPEAPDREPQWPRLEAVSARVVQNSDFPWAPANGPVWTGRGTTVSLSASGSWRWRWLSARLAPVLWQAQNSEVALIPGAGTPGSPFADPMRPRGIDLPQRFGPSSVGRIDPGESALEAQAFGLRAAFTSAQRSLGVSDHHSILMSPTAPGFPRIELGTARPWATPLGDFQGTLAAGRLAQTPWAPQRRVGARSGTFIEGRWRPFRSPRLELGVARFYHQDWQGWRLGDFAIPFGSLFFDDQRFGNGAPDNQLASLFGALRLDEIGLELWGEFGKNDRSTDLRDLALEFEHTTAWLVGIKRSWAGAGDLRWEFHATAASGRFPASVLFRPPVETFYDHNILTQGHTHRGLLLGSYLLERNGGAELRLDRISDAQHLTFRLASRDLNQTRGVIVPEARLRQEWSVVADWTRKRSDRLDLFVRAGLVADINRHPTRGDAYNAVLATGVTWRP